MLRGAAKRKHTDDLPWLLAARLALLGLCLAATSLALIFPESPVLAGMSSLYGPLAFLFALTAVSALWLKWNPQRDLFVGLSFLIDILLITALLYATGGPMSPFQFLFLPLALLAGFILPMSGAITIVVLSGAVFCALGVLMTLGVIPLAHPSQEVYAIGIERLITQSLGLWSTLALLAVMSNVMGRRLQIERTRAQENESILLELGSKQKALIHSLAEAVILFNSDGTIESVSRSWEKLFRIQEEDCKGDHLLGWLEEQGLRIPNFDYQKEELSEFETEFTGPRGRVRLRGSWQGIRSKDDRAGYGVLILQDVTEFKSLEDQVAMQERMARLLATEDAVERQESPLKNFIGETRVMKKIFSLIERVADSDATVLVTGESGTGKELVASAIHQCSERKQRPFVAVNCGAIPEGLIESELFGHKKGSFTGAIADHTGLLRKAQGGTLFLDEVGELPLSTQAKLLRAIQEKQIRAVGSDEVTSIDCRIIAATNRDLKQEVGKGSFREDLYYRLNVVGIRLPPLRERKEDIPLLVHALLGKLSRRSDKRPVVSSSAMQILCQYHYPGNVRELENILERALVLGGDVVLPEHLSECLEPPATTHKAGEKPETRIIIDEELELPIKLDDLLARVERSYIEQALVASSGVKKRAAHLLGMNFRSFRYRLQKYDIASD